MLFPVFILFAGLTRLANAQTCFWPDGSTATDYVPCSGVNDDGVRACCAPDDMCLYGFGAIGNCLSVHDGFLYRGGCTSQNWADSSTCAGACWHDEDGSMNIRVTRQVSANSSKLDNADTFVPLAMCGNGVVCCGWPSIAGACCSTNGVSTDNRGFFPDFPTMDGGKGWFWNTTLNVRCNFAVCSAGMTSVCFNP